MALFELLAAAAGAGVVAAYFGGFAADGLPLGFDVPDAPGGLLLAGLLDEPELLL